MATMPMPTTDMQQPQTQPPPTQQPTLDASSDAPATEAGEGKGPVVLSKEQQDALIQIRKTLKEGNVAKRLIYLRRVMRAFEVLKNNPYIVYNDKTQEFDTLDTIMQGIPRRCR
jgi:plasmid stabilization system protein ParE